MIDNKNINFILSKTNDNVIGYNNKLLFSIKEDMEYFKENTMFVKDTNKINSIIMGFNTFLSLKSKPLKKRLNIVITSKYEEMENNENLMFFKNIKNAILYSNLMENIENIWIIGGSKIFDEINFIKPNNILISNFEINIFKEEKEEKEEKDKKNNFIMLSDNFINFLEKNYEKIKIKNIEVEHEKIKYINFITYEKNNDVENNDILEKYTNNIIKNIGTNDSEQKYLDLLVKTIIEGQFVKTRNSHTWSIFGDQLIFDMKDGFPLLTSKKIQLRLIFEELMFFIRGYTDNQILLNKNVNIWKQNTTKEFIQNNQKYYQDRKDLLEENDMGPMYGFIWRHFGCQYTTKNNEENEKIYKNRGIDQFKKIIEELKNDPSSRRIIMTTFNPEQVENGVLYPCHSIVLQFYTKKVKNNDYLTSIKMYQRSSDFFHGLPFNIASTSLLLYLICDHLNQINNNNNNYIPDKVIITLGDGHIYQSHINSVITQINSEIYKFPKIEIINNGIKEIEKYEWENINLIDYKYSKIIKANMIA